VCCSQACLECGTNQIRMKYCAMCGVEHPRMRIPRSATGNAAMATRTQRLAELAVYVTGTNNAISTREREFVAYLRDEGVAEASLFGANPDDVIGFLAWTSASGNTPIHNASCTQWGLRRDEATCTCPRRKAASTLRTYKFAIQSACRDAGMTTPWCPMRRAGNPADARRVAEFLELTEREQASGGVGAKQAALVDEMVFQRLTKEVLRAWRRHAYATPPDIRAAYDAACDALFYVVLWNSGLRASDALRLNTAQFVFTRTNTYIQIGVTKRFTTLEDTHRITIHEDAVNADPLYSVVAAWKVLSSTLDAADVLPIDRNGAMFRALVQAEDGSWALGTAHSWSTMHTRHVEWLKRAGFNDVGRRTITLHSFHGSRAAREQKAGISREVTCDNMRWTTEMYDYYTKGREPLILDDVLRSTT
jgi:integrase